MNYADRLAAAGGNPSRVRADEDVYCSIRRYFAYLIDTILVAAGTVALYFKLGWFTLTTATITNVYGQQVSTYHLGYTAGVMGSVVSAFLTLGYFVLLEWTAGWTIGKMILGLRVMSLNGDQLSLTQAVIRNVLRIVDGLFGSLVALISMLMSDCRQRVGDRAAGTMVVRF